MHPKTRFILTLLISLAMHATAGHADTSRRFPPQPSFRVHYTKPSSPMFLIEAQRPALKIMLVQGQRPGKLNSSGTPTKEVIAIGEYGERENLRAADFNGETVLGHDTNLQLPESLVTTDLEELLRLIALTPPNIPVEVGAQALENLAAFCAEDGGTTGLGRGDRERCLTYHKLINALLSRRNVSSNLAMFAARHLSQSSTSSRSNAATSIVRDGRYQRFAHRHIEPFRDENPVVWWRAVRCSVDLTGTES
jgi:hypothetical protein